MTCKDCIHSGLCYKENEYENFPDRCGDFSPNHTRKKEAENDKKGKWIKKVDDVCFVSHICSECGAEIEVEDCSDNKFCFNCGAEMEVEDE